MARVLHQHLSSYEGDVPDLHNTKSRQSLLYQKHTKGSRDEVRRTKHDATGGGDNEGGEYHQAQSIDDHGGKLPVVLHVPILVLLVHARRDEAANNRFCYDLRDTITHRISLSMHCIRRRRALRPASE